MPLSVTAHTDVVDVLRGVVRHGGGELELLAGDGELAVVGAAVPAHQAVAERLARVRVANGAEGPDHVPIAVPSPTVLLLRAMSVGGSLTLVMLMVSDCGEDAALAIVSLDANCLVELRLEVEDRCRLKLAAR